MEKETPIQNNRPLQRAGGLSVSPSRTPPSVDTTPPTQVTGLIVGTVSNSQRKLGWKQIPASDFNRYNIYRGTTGEFTGTPGVTQPAGTSTPNSCPPSLKKSGTNDSSSEQSRVGLYVPLYTYPTSSTWNTLVGAD